MRVDFYRLSRDSAESAAALLARKSLEAGHRVLLVAEGQERLQDFSRALWSEHPVAFLAHGMAGGADDARQLILLAEQAEPANGGDFLLLADGVWRDPGERFGRVMLLFDESTIERTRACWRQLGEDERIERRFWKQDENGRWVEGP